MAPTGGGRANDVTRIERPAGLFRVLVALLAMCHAAALGQAEDTAGAKPVAGSRPVTALVLSGGGARGAAHVGVLAVLEQARVPVDMVVGTSMGSIVGGLYASGLSPGELEARLLAVDWREVYTDRPRRKSVPFRRKQDDGLPFFDFEMGLGRRLKFQRGLIAGHKFSFNLQTWILHTAGVEHFDELPLPFRAVATDLANGDLVVLDRGNLGTAIRASMAVPSVLTPVEIDGRVLVDGGVVRNLPVDVARELGAERIIAVDISSPLDDLSRLSIFSIASQSLNIYSEQNVREQRALLDPGDLLITPGLDGITATSFEIDKLRQAIAAGVEAARRDAARLSEFAVSPAEYEVFLKRQRQDASALAVDVTIDRIHVEGYSRVDPRQILTRIQSTAGTALDLDRLRDDLDRIYEIGEFQDVEFRLERDDGQTVLIIDVEEKSWGPHYVRFGLALQSNVEDVGEFSVLAQLTRTQINSRGAEWKSRISVGSEDRLFSEFYQPLDYHGFLFVAPSMEYLGTEVSAPGPGGELERVQLDFVTGVVDLGVQFRNVGELRVGVIRGAGDVDILTDSSVTPFSFDIGGWRSILSIDRLDNANFPRHGSLLNTQLFVSREALGADQDYEELELFVAGATSFGKNTVLGWVDGASNLGSELPFFEGPTLGGFLNLSGIDAGTVAGNVGGVLTGLYYRQVALMAPTLGGGVYVGGSVETGGAWERSEDASLSDLTWAGSVFVGADTKFGPLYLGYGRAETGDGAFYFFLGRLFSENR